MKLRSGVALTLLLLVACRPPEKPRPPPDAPAITSFSADKPVVRRGEVVTFSFTTVRTKMVELIDQTGARVEVQYDELNGAGTAQTMPSRSGFYVLRAEGEGGRDAAFVQVGVDEGLQNLFLAAVPEQVKPGERVDLVWSALGGRNVRLAAGTRTLASSETGSVSETPELTTTYTLSGERADGSRATQSVTVTVVPVIQSFTASPPSALPGESITLEWKAAGADEVVLEEASFGRLVATRTDLAMGRYVFTIPRAFADAGQVDAGAPQSTDGGAGVDAGSPDAGRLPDGGFPDAGAIIPPLIVREGFPLRFTLAARTSTPPQETKRALVSRVGKGPSIDLFEAPTFGTRGRGLPLRWRTTGAARVELRANGFPVFSPLPNTSTSGTFTFGNFGSETVFTLVAWDFNDQQVTASRTVRAVPPPRIVSFMAPMATATAGMRITVTWQTQDATFVLIRPKNGPAFFRDDGVNSVGNGTAQFIVPLTGTYVFEAWNAAGAKDSTERTIEVGAPVAFTISPELLGKGELTTMSWDLNLVAPSDITGLLAPPPGVAMNPNGFDDLTQIPAARTLVFANRDDDVAEIELPNGFVFPFVTRQVRAVTVSTNGFVALSTSGAEPVNQDLGDIGYAGPPLLAPFWDDLELGTDGRVLWDLDESAAPRRLTISWHDVKRVGATGSNLTFQVQLFENGKFLFAWKRLDGPGADGSDATIGAVDERDTYQGLVSYNNATSAELAVDTERVWFSGNAEIAGQRQLRIRRASTLGFVVQTATDSIPVYGRARAFDDNEVPITEAMPAPLASLGSGQWIELSNPGAEEVDVGGLRLESTSGSGSPFVIPANTLIPPNGFLVLGQSLDPMLNGDAGVRVEWTQGTVPLAVPDEVKLVLPTARADGGIVTVGSLSWPGFTLLLPDGGTPADGGGLGVDQGQSWQPPENVLVRTGEPPYSCSRSLAFGPPDQIGTPGGRNELCFDYTLDEIPLDFVDITQIGIRLITVNSWDDEGANITIPPFPYFQDSLTSLRVSGNGWVTATATTVSGFTNKTRPSAAAPVGTIAPFWDDLGASGAVPAGQSTVYAARLPGVTIVEWARVEVLGDDDDMTFEVKLFDSGVIEFHYAAMISGTSASNANGNGATRWIENPAGTQALAISVNRPTVRSFSAFRFTPRRQGTTP